MPQSLAKIYVHAVFSTKNREPTIQSAWREELFRVLSGIANNIDCQALVNGGVADHVHMMFILGRTHTVAGAIGTIKSTSSAWVNEKIRPAIEFHWQAGYAAFSVSQSNVEAVRNYIQNQERHHSKQTFQDELREWLRRYEIHWDERYLWE